MGQIASDTGQPFIDFSTLGGKKCFNAERKRHLIKAKVQGGEHSLCAICPIKILYPQAAASPIGKRQGHNNLSPAKGRGNFDLGSAKGQKG